MTSAKSAYKRSTHILFLEEDRGITVDEPRTGILASFISEPELVVQLWSCVRSLARWRGLRIGPPHTKIGRETRYTEAVRAWLVAGGTNCVAPRASMHRSKA